LLRALSYTIIFEKLEASSSLGLADFFLSNNDLLLLDFSEALLDFPLAGL
jgi:hypothetical protein